MFCIRQQQMEVFEQAAKDQFLARAAAALPDLPAAVQADGDAGLRDFLARGLASARGFGLESEADVFRFFCLLHTHLPSGDSRDLPRPAQNHLLAYGVPASRRLDRLEQWLHRAVSA